MKGLCLDAMLRVDAEVCDCLEIKPAMMGGECVSRAVNCESHDDCLGARVCKEGVCSDGCRDNADCSGALACDQNTQACVEVSPCNSDANCFEGRLCLDGNCSIVAATMETVAVPRPVLSKRVAAWRPRHVRQRKTAQVIRLRESRMREPLC